MISCAACGGQVLLQRVLRGATHSRAAMRMLCQLLSLAATPVGHLRRPYPTIRLQGLGSSLQTGLLLLPDPCQLTLCCCALRRL